MESNEVRIIAFGIVAEKVQSNEIVAPATKDSDELLQWLDIRYPELKAIKISVAVNKRIICENTPLSAACEIALLPPFSGG